MNKHKQTDDQSQLVYVPYYTRLPQAACTASY